MPNLWSDTVAGHREEVREAILEAAVALARERGLRSVTMSEIAATAGIGRATLYKYFADVETILAVWHERKIAAHLEQLRRIGEEHSGPGARVQAILDAYALIRHESQGRHGDEFGSLLHRDQAMEAPREQLRKLLRDALAAAAQAGEVRQDASAEELAIYALHALDAAAALRSKSAVRRLVAVTMDGLRASD